MRTIAIALTSLCLGSSTVCAQKYEEEFYNLLIDDRNFAAADSLLDVWQKTADDDPEFQIALFNSYLNKSRTSMLKIAGVSEPVEGEHLVLTDSLGNTAGTISDMVMWNDSLYNECINVIQDAIKRWPDRLDMRWGATKALAIRERWEDVAEYVNAVLDRSAINNYAWLWTYGEALGDKANEVVNEGAFTYLAEMMGSTDSVATVLGERLAKRMAVDFPNDCRVTNMLGAICHSHDDLEGALNYFIKADEECPGDGIIACNIAAIYMQMGNNEKAIECFEKIKDDSRYDEESRDYAKRAVAHLKGEYKPLEKYSYFFRFLPSIAANVSVAEGKDVFSEPKTVNTDMAAYNLSKSPFQDSEISVTAAKMGDKDIFVWQFPEPQEITHCLYVTFVPNGENYSYYTLEKSLNGGWVIGSQKGTSHFSVSSVDERPASLEEYVALLTKCLTPKK